MFTNEWQLLRNLHDIYSIYVWWSLPTVTAKILVLAIKLFALSQTTSGRKLQQTCLKNLIQHFRQVSDHHQHLTWKSFPSFLCFSCLHTCLCPSKTATNMFVALLNPYMATVPIRGRLNHVVLQTFYLRNGKELDRNVLNFFKEEEISYNMSKF